jgi:hypothetical protein
MPVIRWKSFAVIREPSLCSSCVWGTVRKGYRGGEVETFCRLVGPNGLVPFAVQECTDYSDRRARVVEETKPDGRRFGFVTTLSLEDENEELSSSIERTEKANE